MKTKPIYANNWLQIHPYTAIRPSDTYFIELANRLFAACTLHELPETFRKKLALYAAAYLEDQVSGLGLWQSFISEHQRLYGSSLPFYPTDSNYYPDEVNEADLCFLIWNAWQKSGLASHYLYPLTPRITEQASAFYTILDKAYENAPENEILTRYFEIFEDEEEANHKLTWLFGHTYLTEPSMYPYAARIAPSDRFIMPTGPLALFLHEWIDLLSDNADWKKIKGLYTEAPIPTPSIKETNQTIYRNFTEGTGGKNIVYLNGYETLKRFLTHILQWPDDESHTLPQMKAHRNFILATNPEKGILLAKDICEYIADKENPMYDRGKAQDNAFRLLTEEGLCPPDLLTHCIRNGLLPDAHIPATRDNTLVQENMDFIARHSLLYYYRGD
ncbi:DUF3843 family protein [Bacteroides gallinaceum]|uniref:DUF3843 family protein n=1 Tax=Bacteroides gallinaceum TaxID=1462571 RepID=UPI0025A3C542|nr:DUF3843 family protein [Bacteroides gallinaceum]MDM8153112.1 DUF3843 family protein [Bacteroides gallinaceum]